MRGLDDKASDEKDLLCISKVAQKKKMFPLLHLPFPSFFLSFFHSFFLPFFPSFLLTASLLCQVALLNKEEGESFGSKLTGVLIHRAKSR